jgi:hypothetical protein
MTKRAKSYKPLTRFGRYKTMRKAGYGKASARVLIDGLGTAAAVKPLAGRRVDILREAIRRTPSTASAKPPEPGFEPSLRVYKRRGGTLEASVEVLKGHQCVAYVEAIGPRTREKRWNLYGLATPQNRDPAIAKPQAVCVLRDVPVKQTRPKAEKEEE